nr:transcriptional regulator [Erwinia sp. JUb26]
MTSRQLIEIMEIIQPTMSRALRDMRDMGMTLCGLGQAHLFNMHSAMAGADSDLRPFTASRMKGGSCLLACSGE